MLGRALDGRTEALVDRLLDPAGQAPWPDGRPEPPRRRQAGACGSGSSMSIRNRNLRIRRLGNGAPQPGTSCKWRRGDRGGTLGRLEDSGRCCQQHGALIGATSSAGPTGADSRRSCDEPSASPATSASSSTATAAGPAGGGLDDDSRRAPAGADKIVEVLGWCEEVGVEVVTLWLLSTDNLQPLRAGAGALLRHHRGDRRATWPRTGRWRVHAGGCARPAADGDGDRAQGGRRTRRRPSTGCRQRRRRLRRAPGDRRRGPRRCCRSTPAGAPRSRSSPRSSTSSTSPSTSTRAASPTRTW